MAVSSVGLNASRPQAAAHQLQAGSFSQNTDGRSGFVWVYCQGPSEADVQLVINSTTLLLRQPVSKKLDSLRSEYLANRVLHTSDGYFYSVLHSQGTPRSYHISMAHVAVVTGEQFLHLENPDTSKGSSVSPINPYIVQQQAPLRVEM